MRRDGKHAIMWGSPTDGFNLIGPFDSAADAIDWANYGTMTNQGVYYIVEIEHPSVAYTRIFPDLNSYEKAKQ